MSPTAAFSKSLVTNHLKSNLSNASSICNIAKKSSTLTKPNKFDYIIDKKQQRKESRDYLQKDQQRKESQDYSQKDQQLQSQESQKQKSNLKLRLNIKVYCDASLDDAFYCGYVRVPLDETTMLPTNLPFGPNW